MDFYQLLNSGKTIIFDGAMGTEIAKRLSDFKCGEELNLTHPEIIQEIHEGYINAGAQVIETNTFGANRIVLAEHGLQDKVCEINITAVEIAKAAARKQTSRVYISGDLGPTGKLPTLGHISFEDMVSAYIEQASALIETGVDLIQIDTCQDVLQSKAAVEGCRQVFESLGRHVPIIVTMTIEPSGTTLLGTEIGAALASLAPLGIAAFGLNCATGPAEMEEHVRFLAKYAPVPIAILPNAGLPEIKNGRASYPLTPKEFGERAGYFVKKLGVQCIGGCCGTTPAHIKELAPLRLQKAGPKRAPKYDFVSSLYSAVPTDQKPRPLIVGERMNINGSKEFREHVLSENFDAAAAIAKKQALAGAHVLDLSVAYAGRNEASDIHEISKRLATASPLPLMIDSTSPSAIEAALSCLGGRSIINSINLEDGGKKAAEILKIAKKHGSAVVALTIDEDGMAIKKAKKLAVAKRLLALCKNFTDTVFIDLLTFTLADPQAAESGSGRETLEALKQLKRYRCNAVTEMLQVKRCRCNAANETLSLKRCRCNAATETLPNVRTILGISNISYGLKPDARKVLNSVFLHEAVSCGLDAAIVHPGQILPLHKIDKKTLQAARDLIYCKDKDCLKKFVSLFEDKLTTRNSQHGAPNPHPSLKSCIIDGNKDGLRPAIETLIKKMTAQDVINKILLPAMQEVGKMFASGKMVLPFVLQSAETMRAATQILSPHLKQSGEKKLGTIVLATVRGDVHDIGKNLVDIILSNNGFRVINMGVKQPIEAILKTAISTKADAIGLSSLLVQSCMVMKDDLAELENRKLRIPVICGGAALTKKFVETELQNVYKGKVFYARDAFDGLKIMNKLI